MKYVFATENPGKLHEIQKLAAEYGIEVLGPSEAGLESTEVDETGATYEENAALKVRSLLGQAVAKEFVIFGDDSGIEIEALDGEPGLHSRRWLGYRMSDDEIIGYALGRMHGIKNRKAKFVSVIAYSVGGQEIQFRRGELQGSLTEVPDINAPNQEGFPFRKIFQVTAERKMMLWEFDNMIAAERGVLSHREQAVDLMFKSVDNQ